MKSNRILSISQKYSQKVSGQQDAPKRIPNFRFGLGPSLIVTLLMKPQTAVSPGLDTSIGDWGLGFRDSPKNIAGMNWGNTISGSLKNNMELSEN